MKALLKGTAVAAAMLGAGLFAIAPAQAGVDFGISIGVPNAVGYDDNSGGYCDSDGCPDDYWNFPVWYGPVFYHGEWYRGPLYYRDDLGDSRVYWVRGGWHHDQWRGDRPDWWRHNHYYAGPALGYEFYLGHGFRHDRDRHWRGNDWRDNNHGGHNDHGDRRDRNDDHGHDGHDHGGGSNSNFGASSHAAPNGNGAPVNGVWPSGHKGHHEFANPSGASANTAPVTPAPAKTNGKKPSGGTTGSGGGGSNGGSDGSGHHHHHHDDGN